MEPGLGYFLVIPGVEVEVGSIIKLSTDTSRQDLFVWQGTYEPDHTHTHKIKDSSEGLGSVFPGVGLHPNGTRGPGCLEGNHILNF